MNLGARFPLDTEKKIRKPPKVAKERGRGSADRRVGTSPLGRRGDHPGERTIFQDRQRPQRDASLEKGRTTVGLAAGP